MFIVLGQKSISEKEGYVADFCPICRDIRKFGLISQNVAAHLYGGVVGEKELIGHTRICAECHSEINADVIGYSTFLKRIKIDCSVEWLAEKTFPNILAVYADRLALEKMIDERPELVLAETKDALMIEAFEILSPNVEKKLSQTNIDSYSGLAMLFSLLIPITVFKSLAFFSIKGQLAITITASAFLLCVFITIYLLSTYPKRYLRAAIYPTLAGTLSKIKPTHDGLEQVFNKLSNLDYKIAKKGNLKDLSKLIMSS